MSAIRQPHFPDQVLCKFLFEANLSLNWTFGSAWGDLYIGGYLGLLAELVEEGERKGAETVTDLVVGLVGKDKLCAFVGPVGTGIVLGKAVDIGTEQKVKTKAVVRLSKDC
jgi:hypothetical protein